MGSGLPGREARPGVGGFSPQAGSLWLRPAGPCVRPWPAAQSWAPHERKLPMRRILLIAAILGLGGGGAPAAEPTVLDLWPGKPPGETKDLPPETDTGTPKDKVGDRRIQKITNVSKPTLAVYRPDKAKDTGAAVIVCPGGGHYILAYDHEGTEVAEWLAQNGVTGIVLKYRVPARDKDRRWGAAVQDAQRAIR